MKRLGKIAAWVFGSLVFVALAGFALLQTRPAKDLLARTLNDMLASPGGGVRIGAIDGVVPFNFTVSRIALTDRAGPWLTIDRAAIDWSPSALLRLEFRVNRLSADTIDVLRLPAPGAPSSGNASPRTLPRLPVGVDLRALAIGRLAVAPAVTSGPAVEARIAAHGALLRDSAALTVELARADGQKGSGIIDVRYDQAADALALKLDIDEPTGAVMDALSGRADHLPLRVTLDGGGPLSGWAGTFRLASGDGIAADLDLTIAHTRGTRVGISGNAAFAALLAENARPLIGDRVSFSVACADDGKGGFTLSPSRLTLASLTLDAQGGQSDAGALNGTMHVAVPDAAAFGQLAGQPTGGAVAIDAALSGTAEKPRLAITEQGRITFGQVAIQGLTLTADVRRLSAPSDEDPRFAVAVDAKAADLSAAEGGATYGGLAIHFAGETDTAGKLVDVRALTAQGGGIDLSGAGGFHDGAADGDARLAATDLAVLGRLLDRPLGGAVTADITARSAPDKTISARITASGDRLRTGIAAADAVLAGPVKLAANLTAAPAGKITLSSLTVDSGRARLAASGGFDPADRSLAAKLSASLTDLNTLSGALRSPLAGAGTLSATVGGTLDRPSVDARANLDRLAFQTMRIDHLDARIAAPRGLNGPAAVDARIISGKLDESLAVEFARQADQAYRLGNLRVNGTGGTIAGTATVAADLHSLTGRLDGVVPDLSIWSGVTGQPIAGHVALAVDLPAGRQGPVKIEIDRLAFGAGPGSIGIRHAALTGTASGDLDKPAAMVDLALAGAALGGVTISGAKARVSAKNGSEDFQLAASGRAQQPVAVDVAGSALRIRGGDSVRLARLTASIGGNRLALARPVSVTIAPGAYAVSNLDLDIDGGALTGGATLSPRAVSADLTLSHLPLHPLAMLAGRDFVAGTLDGRITMSGTERAPRAHVSLDTTGLDLETDGPLPRPRLGANVTADWNGERASLNAALSSSRGEKLDVGGTAPLAFDLATFTPLQPRDEALALTVDGGGRLENLTAIAPLGEDRIGGAFTVAVAVGGTIAAPAPTGRIAVTGGTYANMALGTQLNGIDLMIVGSGQRFVLDHLTATDGKSGALSAAGSVDLAAKPASVALDLGIKDFLVAQTGDATVDADGDVKIGGSLDALTASGKISVRHADLYIPDRLPASVVSLNVVEVGGGRQAVAAPPPAKPVAPVALQIALDAPGQIFVRGHGVTSEWSSHVDIGGNSAAPALNGQLEVVNGTISLLGQTFTIDRGVVRFGGGTDIDPALDIQASATASSITATINVSGTARAPKIALSSVPALPQDEILAQVMFGSNVASLTPSEGIQLAAAAASLAQGGPGMLDRLRGKLGLDLLDLGGASSAGSGGQAATGTTVTGGKYIANGVLVGVQQGITSTSTQALVQVQVAPHISVNSTFGAQSGSGFGAKYSIDY